MLQNVYDNIIVCESLSQRKMDKTFEIIVNRYKNNVKSPMLITL